LLGDVSFGLLTGLEQLEVAADSYVVRLGFFPGGVDYRNVTKANAVKNFGFFDGPGENALYLRWRARSTIWLASILLSTASIYLLFPGLPEDVNPRNPGAGEVKEHGGDGRRGVSREKVTGESGQLGSAALQALR